MLIVRRVLLILFSLFFSSGGTKDIVSADLIPGSWLRNVKIEYEVDKIKHHGIIQIYFPSGYAPGASARTLVVLHGWRQNPKDWEINTQIAELADRQDIVLVCPAMGTTLYESGYYPETTNRWAAMPGGEYTAKTLVDFLRKNFRLALRRESTGIFGISTGGRGAILLASRYCEIFGAAAGLSGDYDSASIKNDRLLISVYGTYDRNRERWEKEVNILKMAENLKNTPVFLAHGTQDAVVPPEQTAMLAERLNALHNEKGGFDLVWEREKSNNALHDWKFWASLVPDVMQFFDQRLKK
jgi:putative tributyrin esterase